MTVRPQEMSGNGVKGPPRAIRGGAGTGRSTSDATPHLRPRERADLGRAARLAVPPGEQGEVVISLSRPDPVDVIEKQARSRVPELVPVRHARMMVSPFTFFRGNAKGMAIDLAAGPTSGFAVQACGDAHLSNFGLFASPERRLLFDVNDFDETLPGPWEWDVKRLAASMAVAGRANGFTPKQRRKIVRATVRRYRDASAGFASMRALDVWYARADMDTVDGMVRGRLSKGGRSKLAQTIGKARNNDGLKAFRKLTTSDGGQARITADPPLIVPISDLVPEAGRREIEQEVEGLLNGYKRTLENDRSALLDRYRFVDLARKVVGVGSVGTRCWVALLQGRDGRDPLLLQVKEAERSVLAPVVPRHMRQANMSRNEGERVVRGQRLMQASSDIFLGWQRVVGIDGVRRDFYVRQLRDMKGSAVVEEMAPEGMQLYGEACAWTLARAHARSGDAIAISAYIGNDDVFPDAMAAYAEQYADLNERDYRSFVEALRTGRLQAQEIT
ncbi:MAG: hypothetical protein QOF53_2679 [Nocardioidaceae bacterium]|nr:hypothetical protein [Nocardioidaceae bacterium]